MTPATYPPGTVCELLIPVVRRLNGRLVRLEAGWHLTLADQVGEYAGVPSYVATDPFGRTWKGISSGWLAVVAVPAESGELRPVKEDTRAVGQ